MSNQSTGSSPCFEGKQTMSDGKTGYIYLLPENAGKINKFTVKLDASAGSALVRYSTSPYNDVKGGNAVFENLINKIAGEKEAVTIGPVTALTMIRYSGTVSIEVVAQ